LQSGKLGCFVVNERVDVQFGTEQHSALARLPPTPVYLIYTGNVLVRFRGLLLNRRTGMAISVMLKKAGRGLAVAAAMVAGVAVIAPQPADAGISNGAAVALGLGSLAVGAAIARPYGYYPYGGGYYAPAPAYYYPPAPAYYPPARSCWDPYYRRYYAC
jgi:hypothetical protein